MFKQKALSLPGSETCVSVVSKQGTKLTRYQYCAYNGELFKAEAPTPELARKKKNRWLTEMTIPKPGTAAGQICFPSYFNTGMCMWDIGDYTISYRYDKKEYKVLKSSTCTTKVKDGPDKNVVVHVPSDFKTFKEIFPWKYWLLFPDGSKFDL